MRRFKIAQGNAEPYEITKEDFEKYTRKMKPYVMVGKDGQTRYFGICPACDNPIQLIGLYKKLENTDKPYGRHYNRDAAIAAHNELLYKYCPYASHIYSVTKDDKKTELTDFERNIYCTIRDYFDRAIFLLENVTGLKINETNAERILRAYLASEGYMYYGATYYNIPWMLLYFCTAQPVYGKLVREGSPLYNMLKDRKDVSLVRYKDSQYYQVDKTGSWLDLQYSFISHKRKIVDDEVREDICFQLSSLDRNGLPVRETEMILDINECRFPKLIHSRKAEKHRNDKLLQMAKSCMPDLP